MGLNRGSLQGTYAKIYIFWLSRGSNSAAPAGVPMPKFERNGHTLSLLHALKGTDRGALQKNLS